jgi:outer membrane protein assembly factor BamE
MRTFPTKIALVTLLAAATAGCGILYKQPIYQGNLLEKTQVDQL